MSVANEFNKFSTIPCLLKDFITVSSSAIPVTNLSLEHVDLSVLDFGMVSQFGQLMSRGQSRGGFLLDHSTLLIQSCFQFFHLANTIYGSISFPKFGHDLISIISILYSECQFCTKFHPKYPSHVLFYPKKLYYKKKS